ncbi:hypothetical protein [Actinomadura harenae]|uniref:Uncharacterized protein n=1 Tax=Actinomadura harenae TaxID=2483351 RepID=A0A3M2MHT0_9ACTN|nr:hypothetical protein [Actinomadura harenae]RMI46848.1 hypothetical protein EBO15_05795 [Actinomadura harenae]
MTGRVLLLHVLREVFPQWDVFVDDRSVWRAVGVVLVSASSAEALADVLVRADPEAARGWTAAEVRGL